MKSLPNNLISVASSKQGRTFLIDPVYAHTRNFARTILDGYDCEDVWTPLSTLEKLILVNMEMMEKYNVRLLLKDGYRPTRASAHMNQWARDVGKYEDLVPKFIGLPGKSQHNNGSAIDLTFAQEGKEVWMGSNFDEFNTNAHIEHSRDTTADDNEWAWGGSYKVIPEQPVENLRKILRESMGKVGFLPYDEEWWHFYDPALLHNIPLDDPIIN